MNLNYVINYRSIYLSHSVNALISQITMLNFKVTLTYVKDFNFLGGCLIKVCFSESSLFLVISSLHLLLLIIVRKAQSNECGNPSYLVKCSNSDYFLTLNSNTSTNCY